MKTLKKVALLCALPLLAVPALGQTAVSGSRVVDNNGNLLASGQWCFGATCLTVTSGAFSGTVTPSTSTVTVTDGGSNTYLTVSSVTIGSSAFNWDGYVVGMTASISGMGKPRIACMGGAQYTQTDAPVSANSFTCSSHPLGQAMWLKSASGTPGTPFPASFTTNPAGAVLSITGQNVSITVNNYGSAQNINATCASAPTPRYTLTGKIAVLQSLQGANSGGGFAWRSSSGQFDTFWTVAAGVKEYGFSSATTIDAYSAGSAMLWSPSVWEQISDDGVNVHFRYAISSELTTPSQFIEIASEPKATGYLQGDYSQVCFFASAIGGNVTVTLQGYSQTEQ